jgi:hypothetical protein
LWKTDDSAGPAGRARIRTHPRKLACGYAAPTIYDAEHLARCGVEPQAEVPSPDGVELLRQEDATRLVVKGGYRSWFVNGHGLSVTRAASTTTTLFGTTTGLTGRGPIMAAFSVCIPVKASALLLPA